MKYHLIAVGGSIMHNLAMELQSLGNEVSGSDDEIYNPAADRLAAAGLYPEKLGWDETRISKDIDIVILGMHAQGNNPELLRSIELGLRILSFPEFIASHIQSKIKIVVTGSHGKTTTTSMIMHVLNRCGMDFDYLVGGLVEGFDRMVRLSDQSKIAVIEGDEYLSSRIDSRPKMLLYKANILITTGIAWDHMNVFPTIDSYVEQFRQLFFQLKEDDLLIYYEEDLVLKSLVSEAALTNTIPYTSLHSRDGQILYGDRFYSTAVFGNHNMANMNAARLACAEVGIDSELFFKSIKDFKGAGNRLELVSDNPLIYRDFAHAPSKVRATVNAIRDRYSNDKILAILELHTYSSLNERFLTHYDGTMTLADEVIIYFDPEAVKLKRLPPLEKSRIRGYFGHDNTTVIDDRRELEMAMIHRIAHYDITLLMSSGKFGGMNMADLIEKSTLK